MKKKLLIAAMLCALTITGCSMPEGLMGKGGNTEELTTEDIADKDDSAESVAATTAGSVEEPANDKELYDKFLNNEIKVTMDFNNGTQGYIQISGDDHDSYTLEELTNKIIAGFIDEYGDDTKISVSSIEYAYIDCGNDGVQELALKINTPSVDDWSHSFIIKDYDGELKAKYCEVSWSRSNTYINKYGYIYGDGSSGAAYHSFDQSFVDGDGNYHFLYGDSSTDNIGDSDYPGDIWANGSSHNLPAGMNLDGNYVFLDFYFGNSSGESSRVYSYGKLDDTDEYDWDKGFRTYFYSELVDDDSMYEDSHPLKAFCNSEGIKITPLPEVDKMIADREKQEGLTAEVRDGEEADWQTLDYSFEPEISSFNDNNFLKRKDYFPISFTLCADNEHITYLRLYADGKTEGNYNYYYYSDDKNMNSFKNDFSARFTVAGQENENIYNLKISDYATENEVGTGKEETYGTGTTNHTSYVEVPGFENGGENYILYCPGTPVSSLDSRVVETLKANEYWEENFLKKDSLEYYILFNTEGAGYVWRGNTY